MATQAQVRRIALALPDVKEGEGQFAFSVRVKEKSKGFAWVWMERLDPKKARVPNPAVLAVRVANLGQKELLLGAEPDKFFTEPHYNGFPAVLVRLAAVTVADLKLLLGEAWRCQAAPVAKKRATVQASSKAEAVPTAKVASPARPRARKTKKAKGR